MTVKSNLPMAMSTDLQTKPGLRPAGMAPIPGGAFIMGSDDHYGEERPARRAHASAFLIDITPVTNRMFAEFVGATGHTTTAEQKGASAVFIAPSAAPDLRAPPTWWHLVRDANWRHPCGDGSGIDDRLDHPVVHVAQRDAIAYAAWVGTRLPSEIEWECAARGGLKGAPYAWGDTMAPGNRPMAHVWQGVFPIENRGRYARWGTAPVGSFPPNGYGLYDMIGNVWEWTSTFAPGAGRSGCCTGASDGRSAVIKGGSFLCAPDYCRRYRPAARLFQAPDATACHIGFRCAS